MDNIHDQWDEVEAVSMAIELSDPGQPYSCATWGNNFNESDPLILHGGSPYYHWWGMFETTYVPAHAFVDHNMTVHYKTNTLGSYVANLRIEEMLEDCGECYVDGIYQDFGQEDCCEIFGGTYYGYDDGADYDELSCAGSDAVWSSLCLCSGDVDSDGDGIADNCDDCFNMSGDVNADAIIDILDIVNVVNIILNGGINAPDFSECELSNANFNGDSIINVLDLIQIINAILDNSARIDMNITNIGSSLVALDDSYEDLNINISSDTDITGVEISFYTDYLLDVIIAHGRSDIQLHTDIHNGIQKVIVFSIENIPFTNNELDVNIENGSSLLTADDLDIVVASRSGNNVSVSYIETAVKSFQLDKIYPNPFNPSTTVQYDVEKAGNLNISVYNILGQKVAELYNGHQSYGSHMLRWDATNMSSGVYYINMELNGQVENNKVMLIK